MGILRSKLNHLAKSNSDTEGEAASDAQSESNAKVDETQPSDSEEPSIRNLSSLAKTQRKKARKRGKAPNRVTHSTKEVPAEEMAGLAQFRDLLVGDDLSNVRVRIAKLESICDRQANLIRQLLESVNVLKEGSDALTERCNTETADRATRCDGLDTRQEQLASELSTCEERLRAEIVAQGTVVTGLVHQRHDELAERLKLGLEQLEADKASRIALSEMLHAASQILREHVTSEPTETPAS